MIDPKSLSESDKGRGVVYYAPGGDKAEDGTIVRWNDRYIFVDYVGPHFRGVAATRPEDLEWLRGQ